MLYVYLHSETEQDYVNLVSNELHDQGTHFIWIGLSGVLYLLQSYKCHITFIQTTLICHQFIILVLVDCICKILKAINKSKPFETSFYFRGHYVIVHVCICVVPAAVGQAWTWTDGSVLGQNDFKYWGDGEPTREPGKMGCAIIYTGKWNSTHQLTV